ncbi:hypothetical protein J437_LFUL005392 [Ladona fulva]|uniref:Uncharacterized protein n=1 Tax=Ladona fulva TaxID=123851 RepID=A0A8K0JZ90_LADFU|nr:hypothetical protein J437_LFUL005392 [Ladona fulva]
MGKRKYDKEWRKNEENGDKLEYGKGESKVIEEEGRKIRQKRESIGRMKGEIKETREETKSMNEE